MNIQKLPSLTSSQKQILFHLYKFRYLTIVQLQKLFNHKDPHRVKEWLKDLESKKYISRIVDKKDPTKPHIFCLNTRARYFLKEDKKCSDIVLGRLYKEKTKREKFINKNLTIADCYLFFLSQQAKESQLNFLTENNLIDLKYLPEDLGAYIAVKSGNKTKRYFLDFYDEQTPSWVYRQRVRDYIKYSRDGKWQQNTKGDTLPTILIVCPNEDKKTHAFMNGRAQLRKTFEQINIYVTTKDRIKFSQDINQVWKKVE